jgi:hypothetical protein
MGTGLQEQMDMMGHQDVGMKQDAVPTSIAFEVFQHVEE